MLTELYTTNLVRYLFINYKKKEEKFKNPKAKKKKIKEKKKKKTHPDSGSTYDKRTQNESGKRNRYFEIHEY